ncbi:hypothetical protein B841_10085 [Corynebacterium maris DSM 45190]|uniref:Uncharacterized protein n=1 Tax=Corynebacterium maris DSM 45190 TaxID=1224163 RepID=S5SWB7_9CORY|nr:GNAT family N-acetyltransferase [Corynebacterium maris]AGS35489.1 hypothetical protein B841_10085 [Corynebacterium maris DSM 45190]
MSLSDTLGNPVDVRPQGQSFHITYADDEVAGRADFRDTDGERLFFHTEVEEQYGGRGLASTLLDAALAATAADGLTVVAVCPFVKARLEKDAGPVTWRKPSPDDLTWLRRHL